MFSYLITYTNQMGDSGDFALKAKDDKMNDLQSG